uniref:Uncharacterized protein n=1 Tax=Rhizophora mucronata TaxID=61149 RepID=A0A2P2PV99_RHIMU
MRKQKVYLSGRYISIIGLSFPQRGLRVRL